MARVLSLDLLDHPDLRLLGEIPVVTSLATVRVYGLARPAPPAYLACRVLRVSGAEEGLARPYQADFDPARDVALELEGRATCRTGQAALVTRGSREETYETEADGDGHLVVRASFARGWTALVDGRPAVVHRANGKHRAVAVPAGRHQIALRYEPPGLRLGLALSALSGLAFAWAFFRPRARAGFARG